MLSIALIRYYYFQIRGKYIYIYMKRNIIKYGGILNLLNSKIIEFIEFEISEKGYKYIKSLFERKRI